MKAVARRPQRRLVQTAALIVGDSPASTTLSARQSALFSEVRAISRGANVVGFGIADKVIAGQSTGESGICFYVRRKQERAEIDAAHLLPPVLVDPQGRAVYTDIVEVGEVTAHANVATSPIRGGFSVGHAQGSPGTLGAIVAKGGALCILSAQHVLANFDQAAAGDPILFPASGDGGSMANAIASLRPYAPLLRSGDFPNLIDAALAELAPNVSGNVDASLIDAASPLTGGDPINGMRVGLVGRNSSVELHSVVTGLNVYAALYYPGLGYIGFRNQVACAPFASAGDSGALVVSLDTGKVVGMHIGGSSQISYVTPIRTILAALAATFLAHN